MIEIASEEYPSRRNLLDEENRKKLPKLYETEEKGIEAEALVKFFTPDNDWTWYAAEFDGEDIFYGLVVGHEIELGYFSLSELEQAKGALGLGIERDMHFEPNTLRELRKMHSRSKGGADETSEQKEHLKLINKLSLFGHKLSDWDKRIVEIEGIGKIAQGKLAPEDTLQLVCTFNPEPTDEFSGYFSIGGLLARNDLEACSDGLGIIQSIDLSFKIGGKLYLPNGEMKTMPNEKIRVWPIYNERKQPK